MDWTIIIGFIVGILLPLIFGSILPNSKFFEWGFKAGKKSSSKGRQILGANWEKIENNLTGSFLSFAQGFKDGADVDDAK